MRLHTRAIVTAKRTRLGAALFGLIDYWRGIWAIKRNYPSLDLKIKRQLLNETVDPEALRRAYDVMWADIKNDCVNGDDLDLILGHIRPDIENCLEIGCGIARVACAIASKGIAVTAVDFSAKALEAASVHVREQNANVQLMQASAESLPFLDRSFDLVVTSHTLEHIPSLTSALQEIRRIARKQVVVIVPQEETTSMTAASYHVHCFPEPGALVEVMGMDDCVCFGRYARNEEWSGPYIFFSANVDAADIREAS